MYIKIDLYEVIMNGLNEQRMQCLLKLDNESSFKRMSHEEYEESIDNEIFFENDVLGQALDSLGLQAKYLDCDNFRDYQHQIIFDCIKKYEYLNQE